MAQARSARAISRWKRTRIRNLQYGPKKTRLIRCLSYGFFLFGAGNKCKTHDLTVIWQASKKKVFIGARKQWHITKAFLDLLTSRAFERVAQQWARSAMVRVPSAKRERASESSCRVLPHQTRKPCERLWESLRLSEKVKTNSPCQWKSLLGQN